MHIQKRNGSYKIYVSIGYECTTHKFRTATFKPPEGLLKVI